MPQQTQSQLTSRSAQIRDETRKFGITEQQLGQLLIDVVDTFFANQPTITYQEFKTQLESLADTNFLTDSQLAKLDNIPANIDVIKQDVTYRQALTITSFNKKEFDISALGVSEIKEVYFNSLLLSEDDYSYTASYLTLLFTDVTIETDDSLEIIYTV